jgi:hypothetical protein
VASAPTAGVPSPAFSVRYMQLPLASVGLQC